MQTPPFESSQRTTESAGIAMRTLSFTRRKPLCSETSSGEASAAAEDTVVKASSSVVHLESSQGEGSAVEPREAQASAEPSSQSHQSAESPLQPAPAPLKAGAASPMDRLRRMMRSQSDGGIIIIAGLPLAPIARQPSASTLLETGPYVADEQQSQQDVPRPDEVPSPQPANNVNSDTLAKPEPTPDTTNTSDEPRDSNPDAASASENADACDVFLNASIQLLHSQSDARQRVRQLWFTIQRLRYESQLSDSGVELLHTELLAIMKSFNMEKQEGVRHLKAGFLTLVQAPDWNLRPPLLMKSLFGSDNAGGSVSSRAAGGGHHRMWCTLSEEYGKFEMAPAIASRDESGTNGSSSVPSMASASSSLAGLSTKIKLPTSLSWLLADALQSQAQTSSTPLPASPEPARVIKLHGCQVRKHEVPLSKASGSDATAGARDLAVRHQIQILIPNARSSSSNGANQFPAFASRAGSLGNATSGFSQVSYSIYTFEVVDSDGGEQECDAWFAALDRVCMFHLYMLERSIRDVRSVGQYREVLSSHLPLCISLSWLRNRIDRHDTLQGGGQQQQMLQQHQQQQRRSSKSLSMVQIIKDLERDKILVDQKLIATTISDSSTSTSNESNATSRTEQGNISEVVKYVVMKVMDFVRRSEQRAKDARVAGSESAAASPQPSSPPSPTPRLPPTSPTNRFTKYSEARALTFVERVLRGSSRTQSGGDIYDAISFFCQHSRVSICPVSQDACPVQMNIVSDDASDVFQVEVQVCMRFKVIEMTPMTATMSTPSVPTAFSPSSSPSGMAQTDSSMPETPINSFLNSARHSIHTDHSILEGPKVWAVLEGTLTRQFTLGKLSEPGAVTIDVIPLDSDLNSSS